MKNLFLSVLSVTSLAGCNNVIFSSPLEYGHTFDEFLGYFYEEGESCDQGLYIEEASERVYNLYEYQAPDCDPLQASLVFVYGFGADAVSAPLGSGKAYYLVGLSEPELYGVFNMYRDGFEFEGDRYVSL